jgi:DNA-binding beta-propeller fold protein YncE
MLKKLAVTATRLRQVTVMLVAGIGCAGMTGMPVDAGRPGPDAAGPQHATGQIPQGSVWVVNRDRGELTVFDARTGDVLATRPVGAGAHDICISEHAGKAYIAAETITPCSKSTKTPPSHSELAISSRRITSLARATSSVRSLSPCGRSLTRRPAFRNSGVAGSNSKTPKRYRVVEPTIVPV